MVKPGPLFYTFYARRTNEPQVVIRENSRDGNAAWAPPKVGYYDFGVKLLKDGQAVAEAWTPLPCEVRKKIFTPQVTITPASGQAVAGEALTITATNPIMMPMTHFFSFQVTPSSPPAVYGVTTTERSVTWRYSPTAQGTYTINVFIQSYVGSMADPGNLVAEGTKTITGYVVRPRP